MANNFQTVQSGQGLLKQVSGLDHGSAMSAALNSKLQKLADRKRKVDTQSPDEDLEEEKNDAANP